MRRVWQRATLDIPEILVSRSGVEGMDNVFKPPHADINGSQVFSRCDPAVYLGT